MTSQRSAWEKRHKSYQRDELPSSFAHDSLKYFPPGGKVLELGAGQGQDSRLFAEHGFTAVSTDFVDAALEANRQRAASAPRGKLTIEKVDLTQPLPFPDGSFDAVYARLSLHYFTQADTKQIFAEIFRVLRPGGALACLMNSTDDPEYGTGEMLETDYYAIGPLRKRFFSIKSMRDAAAAFDEILLDDQGAVHKANGETTSKLVRFIGTKP